MKSNIAEYLSQHITIGKANYNLSPFAIQEVFLKGRNPADILREAKTTVRFKKVFNETMLSRTRNKHFYVSVELPDIFNQYQKNKILLMSTKNILYIDVPSKIAQHIDVCKLSGFNNNVVDIGFYECSKNCSTSDFIPYFTRAKQSLINNIQNNILQFADTILNNLFIIYKAGKIPDIRKNIFLYLYFIQLLKSIDYSFNLKIPTLYKKKNTEIQIRILYGLYSKSSSESSSKIHIEKDNLNSLYSIYFKTLFPLKIAIIQNKKPIIVNINNIPISLSISTDITLLKNFEEFANRFTELIIKNYRVNIFNIIDRYFELVASGSEYTKIKSEAKKAMREYEKILLQLFSEKIYKNILKQIKNIDIDV